MLLTVEDGLEFHSSIEMRETMIPAATVEDLIEKLRTIGMPVYDLPDNYTVGFTHGSGFRYTGRLWSAGIVRPPGS